MAGAQALSASKEGEPRPPAADGAASGAAGAGEPAAAPLPPQDAKRLLEAVAAAEKRAADAENRLLYMRADFANYRKRVARDMQQQADFATEGLALELLDVVDDLERAVSAKAAEGPAPADPWRAGVEATLRKLLSLLAAQGVEPFESVGDAFDPQRHDALATVELAGIEPGRVTEEARRGYTMKGRVLRPAAVKVTRQAPGAGGAGPQGPKDGAPRPDGKVDGN